MSPTFATRRGNRHNGALVALCVLLAACGGNDKNGTISEGLTGPAAGYLISVSPTSLSIAPGASASATVTVTRTGTFSGAVTLTVDGAPAGMVVTVPTVGGGASVEAVMTVAAGSQVATGNYMLTVRGSASGLADRSSSLEVTVTAVTVTLDFSTCLAEGRPSWVAFQDGAGSWVRLTGLNDVYTASLGSPIGAVALVTGQPVSRFDVYFLTRDEFLEGLLKCWIPSGGKSVYGTVAGVEWPDEAWISLGGATALAYSSGQLMLEGVKDGSMDLVGFLNRQTDPSSPGLPANRMILRRDQNIPNLGSFGTIDFSGAEAFVPASARVTVSGLQAQESIGYDVVFDLGSPCTYAMGYSDYVPAGYFTGGFDAFGIPSALERSSDFHELAVYTFGNNTSRYVLGLSHELRDQSITLPALIAAPQIATLTGAYPRLQATVAPVEPYRYLDFSYEFGSGTSVDLFASAGWIGSGSTVLTTPDLSSVPGWTNAWLAGGTGSPDWELIVTNTNRTSGNVCFEGSFTRQSVVYSPWMQARMAGRRPAPFGPLAPRGASRLTRRSILSPRP